MLKLGSLKGRGKVEVHGQIIGEIDYEIEIWQSASGAVIGGDAHAVAAAFNTGPSILHLQGGGSLRFIVTHSSPRGALISIEGPIPAF